MSIKLLQEAARETEALLARHPDPTKLPLSARIAAVYASRIPNIVRGIELLVADGLAVEAVTLRRPLIESTLKCAYILQQGLDGQAPSDRPFFDRELLAMHVYAREQLLDVATMEHASRFAPDHFTAAVMENLKTKRELFQAALTNGPKKMPTLDMAEDAGLEAEYRLGFGPTSMLCHGSISAAQMSNAPISEEQLADSLEHSAKAALTLLDVASQLMNDEQGHTKAMELGSRITERP